MRLWLQAVLAVLGGATLAAAHAAGGAAVIPFTLHADNIVVMAALDSSAPLPFVFDTGLSHGGIVTRATARKLGLKPQRDLSIGDAGGGPGHLAKLTRVHAMHLGATTLVNPPFAIIDVPAQIVARGDKPPIAGFIGAPLLEHAVVCIDYAHSELRRWRRQDYVPKDAVAVTAALNHGLVTVAAEVDGVVATLAVDTGNNDGVEFFPHFVHAHDLIARYERDLRPTQATSGTGRTFNTLSGIARQVKFAPRVVLHDTAMLFVAQAFDPAWGIDGLLGYAVLSRLNPCIDRDGGKLYLHPAEGGG